MKFLGAYAILATTVFGEGDTGGTRTVTFDGAALSALETTTESYALTQTTQVTIPIDVSSWATASALAGTIETDLKTEMESAITDQCTSFSTDFPQYTFTLATSALTYTETFTSPNVIINFSVGVDVVYEVQTLQRKRRAVVTSSDISIDVGLRITDLVDAAATDFADFAGSTVFDGIVRSVAPTVSTDSTDASVEAEIDACEVTPCAGDSTTLISCTDIRGSDSTITGRVCERDACSENPCHSTASINNLYACTDEAGDDITDSGRVCVDTVCATETCNGRGTCFETQCTCDAFTATATEILDPTSSTCTTTACASPCLNGGMCLNIGDVATCSCDSASNADSSTEYVDTSSSVCAFAACSTACENDGICTSSGCDCDAVVYDSTMEIEDTSSTTCAASACPGTCLNSGVCTDVASTATCVCHVETGFPGSFFEGSVCGDFNYAAMVAKIVELNTKDGTIDQDILDGVVAADAKVDVVKAALETAITDEIAAGVVVADDKVAVVKAALETIITDGVVAADAKVDVVKSALETAITVGIADGVVVADAKVAVVKAALETIITDGVVAADAKVDIVKAALETAITALETASAADIAAVNGDVATVNGLVDALAEAMMGVETDLTAKIDADLVAQASAIATETDAKIETAKTALETLITGNTGTITVLTQAQDILAAKIVDNLFSIGTEVATRVAEDELLNVRVDGEVADIATNAASIQTESGTRDAADVALGARLDSELADIAANSASIQANTDADATFRSFNWKDGVQSIYNMVSATNLADLITEKETLDELIAAPVVAN